VIPRDHRDTHPRTSACCDRSGGIRARWILQPYEPEQVKMGLRLVCVRSGSDFSHRSVGDGEHAKPPICHAVGHPSRVVCIAAARNDRIGRPFNEQFIARDDRHSPPVRIERPALNDRTLAFV
jgi:hypothetical protein